VGEILRPGDVFRDGHNVWAYTENTGVTVRDGWQRKYRRRIEPEPEPQANPDDPSGPGWRDVEVGDSVCEGDMWSNYPPEWHTTESIGQHRRRIEQQPSDSEPVADNDDDIERAVEELENNMTVTLLDAAQQRCRELDADLRTAYQQNAELSALVAEADRGGQQVNAELQQLRQQVQKLERELKAERDSSMIALRSQNRLGQEALAEALQDWLRPVIELVAEHPEDCGPLAVSVLGYLPGIASRLIEE
jgi:hypothetical protein